MKLLCLFMLLFSFNIAHANSFFECSLEKSAYSTLDYIEYQLESTAVISRKTLEFDSSGDIFDSVSDVHYKVRVDNGSLAGTLCLQIDQPGPCDSAKVGPHKVLRLVIEDLYNSGKTKYDLACQAI